MTLKCGGSRESFWRETAIWYRKRRPPKTPSAEITRSLPDAAVIDVNLPGISGIKLVEILRGEPKTAALPILLLTALNKQGDKVQGFQRGADDYVTKPYDPRRTGGSARGLAPTVNPIHGPRPGIDLRRTQN